MPFTQTPDLPPNPLVRVFFSGQLILTPADSTSGGERNCEVLVNRAAVGHHLSVEVRQKRANHPDVLIMRHAGPLSPIDTPIHGAPDTGLFVGIVPGGGSNPEPQGVRGYNGAPSSEGCTLAEALSLADIHKPPSPAVDLTIDKEAGRPCVLLNHATLYTAERSAGQFEIVKGGDPPQQLRQFASLVGANIYATQNQIVVMQWNIDGRLRTLTFRQPPPSPPAPPRDLFTYEVYVSNDPLFDPGALEDNPPLTHDELKEYYRIHPGVPRREQFILKRPQNPPPGPDPLRGSPRIPCMPLLGEG